MKLVVSLVLLTCMITWTQGRMISKCELMKIFQRTGLGGYSGHSVENWICLAKHESNFNTAAVNNNGASHDYGIFQINSKWWCNDGKTPGSKNACFKSCASFMDDNITDDIECAKRVVRDPQGLSAWVAWKKHCKGKNLSQYTSGC